MEEFEKYIIEQAKSILEAMKGCEDTDLNRTIFARISCLKDSDGNYLLTKYDND